MSLSVYLRCLHHPSFHCGHKELSKRKSFLFRIPDSVSLLWNTEQTLHHAFWYYYDYLWANEFTPPPPWFVNTCVCTVLLWALDTGKETYIVFMKMKKKKSQMLKKKKSVIIKKKKAHVFLNVPTFFCQNVQYTFWKSINYCCTLLLWWPNNRKYEAQSVFVGWEGRSEKPKRAGSRSRKDASAWPGSLHPCSPLRMSYFSMFPLVSLQQNVPVCQQTDRLYKSLIVTPLLSPSPCSSEGLFAAVVR